MVTHPSAFEGLYREHVAYVWRTLHRLGCPRGEVADATQDVFLIAFRKLDEFQHRSRMSTWLFGICYRHTLERRRKAARHSVAPPSAVHALLDPSPDQSLVVELGQQRAVLELILEQLTIEQRAVFALHELDGLEGNEIAEALDIPLGTVYSRLRSAREVFWRIVEQRRAKEGFEEQRLVGSR